MNPTALALIGVLGAALIGAVGLVWAARRTSKTQEKLQSETSATEERKQELARELQLIQEGRERGKELLDETKWLATELRAVRTDLSGALREADRLNVQLAEANVEMTKLRSDLHESQEEVDALRTRIAVLEGRANGR